ncbi:MAG TPA: hypothetical protein DCZ41_04480 [Firmicutes bacterium]|nr:hypothetical protein [Bacillota bacterium]
MKAECIECLVDCNREIEFTYLGKEYSITYYNDKRENYISVCEAFKKPIDVKNASEVLKLKIGSLTLEQIFAKLPDSAFDIY